MTGMQRSSLPVAAAVVTAVTALVAFAPTAAATAAPAAPGAGIQAQKLVIGDTFVVKGTRILCVAIVSSGKRGIACVLFAKSAPITGSYGVGMAVDGTSVLTQIKADGNPKLVLRRRPQATARRVDEVYSGSPGDAFALPIDAKRVLVCLVTDVKPAQAEPLYRGIKVGCWRALTAGTGPVPSSDAVQLSDRMASIVKFDAKGDISGVVVVKKQPA